ncbi:hypothetical protein CMUS01_01744 [Colletotrichum musicola]|uniref:Uncharacterized protein n=1 Tax=Colletotrichum musicola TaxID=2175873 RepID=A0A8H6U8G1_9PEZI|nr:hypothetical protein CMUS01_01744 [Colletotrichum musicola]
MPSASELTCRSRTPQCISWVSAAELTVIAVKLGGEYESPKDLKNIHSGYDYSQQKDQLNAADTATMEPWGSDSRSSAMASAESLCRILKL